MKNLIIIVVVVLVGWLAWAKLPGLRTKVSGTVDEYGGWTEEARRADPVGFLTFAEAKLGADIEAFKASRVTLAETKTNAQTELAKNSTLLASAEELAEDFRQYFLKAEAAQSWPVDVRGSSYTRKALIKQVESILGEGATYKKVAEIYAEVIESAEAQREKLRDRIQSTEATLLELKAQRELVRVDKLTAQADELLAQVDALINGNRETLDALDEPRSVEDLLAASKDAPAEVPASSALDFLKGE